jgi:recombinational DNA repair ATPase RecF
MRILEVVVHAFGPFRDRKFTFAPGFTLVHGANEAGKSTLHAALYAAVCGQRRGKGRRETEQDFERRHRPWSGSGWKVGALVELADGQRIELSQDLEDKAQCRAIDAIRGRDVTSQIENEGTPDAARFLGLDRASFLATACVRQTELLAIRADPAALQESLQRGIDTSGSDATAAEALERIDVFLREQVGSRQTNSTKPLRRAQVRVSETARVLERARGDHEAYCALLGREDALLERVDQAHKDLERTQAALALAQVGARRRELERARELIRRHGTRRPATLVEDEERSLSVERALQALASRPEVLTLQGLPAAVLRNELREIEASLRDAPPGTRVGDRQSAPTPSGNGEKGTTRRESGPPERRLASGATASSETARGSAGLATRTESPSTGRLEARLELQPAPEILEMAAQVRGLRRQVDTHRTERLKDASPAPGNGLTAAELRQLVSALSQPEPVGSPRLETRRRQIELQSVRARRSARRMVVAAALCGVVGAPIAIAAALGHGILAIGIGLLIVAGALALVSLRQGARAPLDELREVDADLATLRVRHDDWRAARDEALRVVRWRELVGDPRSLGDLATAREAWDRDREQRAAWEENLVRLQRAHDAQVRELGALLRARGIVPTADVLADTVTYQKQCALRARRRDLEVRLAERERDELARDRIAAQRQAAESELLAVARQCGATATDLEECRASLEAWRNARRQRLEQQEQARRDWADLDRLLGGKSLAAAEAEAAATEEAARSAAVPFTPQEILTAECDEAARTRQAASVREAELALAKLRGEIAQYGTVAPRVSEAEEEMEAAQRELQRLQQLESTLQTTREFLQRAQERVHLDIAPRLAAAILPALPAVTGGRYEEVLVDPETFDVQVRARGGVWREAALLSHGTAEQIYLLLRVAMVRQLVRKGEVAPLVLDDVTVHFDRERKRAVLEALRSIAETQQVLLFSQEDDVLDWARTHLTGPRDAILLLEPVQAGN